MNLFSFNGGVHPAPNKADSTQRGIGTAALAQTYYVALQQHAGSMARPIVEAGQRVLKGQMIATPTDGISAAVHAPTSGIVRALELRPSPHPSGLAETCITIDADGIDEWGTLNRLDMQYAGAEDVLRHLRNCGVVGLGGAVFPSDVKLAGAIRNAVPTLILNGAECEPWITCDDVLMRERATAILRGAEIMRSILGSSEILIGVEANKDIAAAAMAEAAAAMDAVKVVTVPTLYPTGGAKQLIKVLTGKETPSGGRATDIGVACFNVATAYAVHRAVDFGEPLISRIVTITGNVRRPQNFETLIGTRIDELIAQTGAPIDDTDGYLMGGPMMGFKLKDISAPVTKATNCLIATSPALFPAPPKALPCIRCTRCADACPADLQPQDLYWFARGQRLDKAENYGIFDCIECGCCAYVCPSHIPLVDYYRYLKSEILVQRAEKAAANEARIRHEFHLERVAREQREKAEKHAQRVAAAQQANPAATPAAADQVGAVNPP